MSKTDYSFLWLFLFFILFNIIIPFFNNINIDRDEDEEYRYKRVKPKIKENNKEDEKRAIELLKLAEQHASSLKHAIDVEENKHQENKIEEDYLSKFNGSKGVSLPDLDKKF